MMWWACHLISLWGVGLNTSDLTKQSGLITPIASDLGWVCQKFPCTVWSILGLRHHHPIHGLGGGLADDYVEQFCWCYEDDHLMNGRPCDWREVHFDNNWLRLLSTASHINEDVNVVNSLWAIVSYIPVYWYSPQDRRMWWLSLPMSVPVQAGALIMTHCATYCRYVDYTIL